MFCEVVTRDQHQVPPMVLHAPKEQKVDAVRAHIGAVLQRLLVRAKAADGASGQAIGSSKST